MDAMQQELKAFKDPALARGLIESIQALAPESATLMDCLLYTSDAADEL